MSTDQQKLKDALHRCDLALTALKRSQDYDQLLKLSDELEAFDASAADPLASPLLVRALEALALPLAVQEDDLEDEEWHAVPPQNEQAVLPLLALSNRLAKLSVMSVETSAEQIMKAGRWCYTDLAAAPAKDLCRQLLPEQQRLETLRHILAKRFPPLFKPHPKLSATTGRVLTTPIGGKKAMAQYHDETLQGDKWRHESGLENVVRLVIDSLQQSELADLWHLVLPPLVAYLDDWNATNKLRGLYSLDALLDKADKSLLTRTGVGKVFQQSVEACFSSLSSPTSPALLSKTHETALKLTDTLYPSQSLSRVDQQARFEHLCQTFSAGVINPWQFKGCKMDFELAVLKALPALLAQLQEAGTSRYLAILVPHLCNLLSESPESSARSRSLADSAEDLLALVARLAPRRIKSWSETLAITLAKMRIQAVQMPDASSRERCDRFESFIYAVGDADLVKTSLQSAREIAKELQ